MVKNFKTYIIESSNISNKIADLKLITKYFGNKPKFKAAFEEKIDEFVADLEANEIYNSKFGDYKYYISRGVEYAYDEILKEMKNKFDRDSDYINDVWGISSFPQMKKVSKIYKTKLKNVASKDIIDFMDVIEPISDVMKEVKGMVKSGRKPKPVDPNKFVKPLASLEAHKLSIKFMTEITDSFKKELTDSITTRYMDAYKKVKDLEFASDVPKESTAMEVASQIFILRYKDKKKILELKKDPETIVQKMINNMIDDIINGFISKSSSKLALILQKKNTPKEHKIIRTRVSNGLVENIMRFVFEDGSEFTLDSSIVYKVSNTGKHFLQYPTRYKNVKFADGSKMSGPSEEKMIKEF